MLSVESVRPLASEPAAHSRTSTPAVENLIDFLCTESNRFASPAVTPARRQRVTIFTSLKPATSRPCGPRAVRAAGLLVLPSLYATPSLLGPDCATTWDWLPVFNGDEAGAGLYVLCVNVGAVRRVQSINQLSQSINQSITLNHSSQTINQN